MPGTFEKLAPTQRHVRSGGPLFVSGDPFGSLYSVHSGFFKTITLDGDGHGQVTGFHMAGDLLGLDGIGSGRYQLTATALEDSVVAVMPYALVEALSCEAPDLQRELHIALSREIAREHRLMLVLGSMRAEQRLATFLVNLSRRFRRRGYSASDFHLRMTRADIGSYLGMTLETVSRLFSRLQEHGIVEVRQRRVRLIDADRLQAIAAPA